MSDEQKKITIYEIAKLSGVSVSTVSRVLNNSPYVSAKTQAHVTDIIEKYHFSPSTVARAMISNHTQTLGVIISDITNPYFSELYLEIQRYAVDFGYSIILCNTFYGGSSHGVSDAIPENTYFQMILDKKVDGVLILGGEIDRDVYKRQIQSCAFFISGSCSFSLSTNSHEYSLFTGSRIAFQSFASSCAPIIVSNPFTYE